MSLFTILRDELAVVVAQAVVEQQADGIGDERLLAFREMQGLALVIVEKRVVIDATKVERSREWFRLLAIGLAWLTTVTNGCSVSHPYSLLYASTLSIWIVFFSMFGCLDILSFRRLGKSLAAGPKRPND
jgi:hypothetical protein